MIIKVKVIPKQSCFKVCFDEGLNQFRIYLKSSPDKGEANREIIKELQGICKCDVKILKGLKSRNKIISIESEKAFDALKCFKF